MTMTTYQVRMHVNHQAKTFFDSVQQPGGIGAFGRPKAEAIADTLAYCKTEISGKGIRSIWQDLQNADLTDYEVVAADITEVREQIRPDLEDAGYTCVHPHKTNRTNNPSNKAGKIAKRVSKTSVHTAVTINEAVKAAAQVVKVPADKGTFIRDCLQAQLKFFRNTQDAADFALELAA